MSELLDFSIIKKVLKRNEEAKQLFAELTTLAVDTYKLEREDSLRTLLLLLDNSRLLNNMAMVYNQVYLLTNNLIEHNSDEKNILDAYQLIVLDDPRAIAHDLTADFILDDIEYTYFKGRYYHKKSRDTSKWYKITEDEYMKRITRHNRLNPKRV